MRPVVPERPLDALEALTTLDDVEMAAWLPRLDTSVLTALVRQVGLADAVDVMRHASASQLTDLLDEELWRSDAAGADEDFDPQAFATWLELMAEVGEQATAARLAELPEDLLRLGVHTLAMVFERDELMLAAQDDEGGELVDKALEGAQTVDVGPYLLVGREVDGWDALVAALSAWEDVDADACEALLERCAELTSDDVHDAGGLHEVLTAAESAAEDAAADREARRARRGFLAPWMARSFLALACSQDLEDVLDDLSRDFVTRAYFRELGRPEIPRERADAAPSTALIPGADPAGPPYAVALAQLGAVDPHEASRRVEEIAYLVNVLCSGSSFRDGRFSPEQALRATMATCGLGLELLLERAPEARSPALRLPADVLFRLGWGVLHRQVRVRAQRLLRKAPPGSDAEAVLTDLAEPCPILDADSHVDSLASLQRLDAWLSSLVVSG